MNERTKKIIVRAVCAFLALLMVLAFAVTLLPVGR